MREVKVLGTLLCDNDQWEEGYCDWYDEIVWTVPLKDTGDEASGDAQGECPQCGRWAVDQGVADYVWDYERVEEGESNV